MTTEMERLNKLFKATVDLKTALLDESGKYDNNIRVRIVKSGDPLFLAIDGYGDTVYFGTLGCGSDDIIHKLICHIPNKDYNLMYDRVEKFVKNIKSEEICSFMPYGTRKTFIIRFN